MSLASDTRDAVRSRPFLLRGLRAGIVNYTAAARFLDVGDPEAVATALRRYAADLPAAESIERSVRVTMHSDLGQVDDGTTESILVVGDAGFELGGGRHTAIVATGDVDALVTATVLERLDANGTTVVAAGFADDSLVLVVERRSGPDVLRIVESAFEGGPAGNAPGESL